MDENKRTTIKAMIHHHNPTNNTDWLLIDLPKMEEFGAEIRGEHPGRPYQILSFYGGAEAIPLPPGKWEMVGKSDQLPAFIETLIVEPDMAVKSAFKNYLNESTLWQLPGNSLISLLKFHNLTASNCLILKKLK